MDLPLYAKQRTTGNVKIKKNRRYKIINNNLASNSKVLDIGCGGGYFFNVWKDKNIEYYGIDYNQYFVDYCTNKGLKVKKCDISSEKLPFDDNSFDFIYCSHVIEHLLSNQQIFFVKEIARVLKKWGKLVLFAPTPYHWYFWNDETHQRPCTHWQLSHLIGNFNLKVIEAKYSNTRFFSNSLQKWLRLPPLRWFLREVYIIAQKDE